jgi:predicted TIM-barrel fold metal-dependent hydrolase
MTTEPSSVDANLDVPLTLVTADSHIGPRLKEDLRQYCPKKYLDDYDEFVRVYDAQNDPEALRKLLVVDEETASSMPSDLGSTLGHYDVHARLKDMDRDGVAAEVIYHGSQNDQCFPFLPIEGGTFNAMVFSPGTCSPRQLELAAVGQRMYNEYLADQCSVEPERHAGLAYLPMWDIEAAISELKWASGAGLKGVNFPAPKLGMKPYDELDWEPFWAECADRGMVLSTHGGSDIDTLTQARPHTLIVLDISEAPEKTLPRIIFSGVFERHQKLKLAMTEVQKPTSRWWPVLASYYDELWMANKDLLKGQLPSPPSEYFTRNLVNGNSLLFLAPREVDIAISDGYAANIMWGSDYPHGEGSWRMAKADEEETNVVTALRHAFATTPPDVARRMAGETAVDVYGLDRAKLAGVAKRINAITPRRVQTPLERIPEEWAQLAKVTVPFPEYHRLMESSR